MDETATNRSLLGPQKSAALERALDEIERYAREARAALDEGDRQRLIERVDCVGVFAQEQVEVLKYSLWPLLYDEVHVTDPDSEEGRWVSAIDSLAEPGGTSVWTADGPQ